MGYPPLLAKAKKFGAKDCTFCHVDPEGGPPWNARGQWLIKEKERRNADAVDPEWLVDYKPAPDNAKKKSKDKDKNKNKEKDKDKENKDKDKDKKEDKKPPESSRSLADSQTERELLNLEREWLDAYVRRDAAGVDRVEADDFTIIYPDGNTNTKADEMAEFK